MTNPSLDKRIATALSESTNDQNDLAALIRETEETVGSITAEMTHCSAQMLDPFNSDFAASHECVEKAKLMLARFEISLPKLKELHAKTVAGEKLAAWDKELKELVVVRDEVATRFRDRYSAVAHELIQIFDAMADVDRQIDSLNTRAYAAGAQPRMRTVEASARGVDYINANTKSLLEIIRLPFFGLGSGNNPALAWPRPQQQIGLAMQAAMWKAPPDQVPPSDEERRARSEAIAEAGRERERGREALNAAARRQA